MNKCLLVTRPRHDEAMTYLHYWAGKCLQDARNKNFEILDLSEEKANEKDFNGRAQKVKPGLIFFNGHGDNDKIAGHDNKVIIEVGKNDNLMQDCIVYALSCRSAARLGESCVNKGTVSYIGYTDDFIFSYEKDKSTRPLEDRTAGLFLEPSNLVVSSLLKGNSAGQAFKKAKENFKRNIRKLITSDSPQEDRSPIPLLIWDMNHIVCLGNQEAQL